MSEWPPGRSGVAEQSGGLGYGPAPAALRQRQRPRGSVSVIRGVQPVQDSALQLVEVVDVHPPTVAAGDNHPVGLTNDELIGRYQAGERLDTLSAAAEMTLSGLHDRLRRLGVPARTATDAAHLNDETIAAALTEHGSVNAAAKALGVPRARLGADAVRLGLRPRPPTIPADLEAVYRQEGTLERTAAHYDTTTVTAARWLRSVGVTLRPGRRPRDG